MSTSKYFTNCRSEEFVWEKNVPLSEEERNCKKNRHDQFFCINELKDKLLPKYTSDEELLRQAEKMAYLTVLLKIEQEDGKIRFGSGFVQRVRRGRGNNCPDKTCRNKEPSHTWGIFTVTTVHHVVQSQKEAESVEVLPFHDKSEPLEFENKTLRGYKLLETDKEDGPYDWCAVECICHNMTLVNTFQKAVTEFEDLQAKTYEKYKGKDENLVIMIGHPHGGPKKVSFGKWTTKLSLKDIRSTQNWCQYRHTAPSCPGNSGSPVLILGQPLCGYGYWFGHPHNHSAWDEVRNDTVTSIGADNIVDGSNLPFTTYYDDSVDESS